MSRTVTKLELTERVARLTGSDPASIKPVLQSVLDCISDYLVEGRRIELRNFGVFSVKRRKPRMGRNPNKPGKDIPIPPIKMVHFKPGHLLKQRVIKSDEEDLHEQEPLEDTDE